MVKGTYGTGSFVVLNMGPTATLSEGGLVTTVCCDERGGQAYALEGSVFTTGAAIQWLRDEMGLIESAAETETVGSKVTDTMGVYVVPAFAGLGAPHWDMRARGAIVGLTRGSGRDQIIRATLDSIAYQTRDVIEVMNRDSGIDITELRVDGGAAVNNVLMQFQADLLGIPVVRPAQPFSPGSGSDSGAIRTSSRARGGRSACLSRRWRPRAATSSATAGPRRSGRCSPAGKRRRLSVVVCRTSGAM